MKKAYLVVTCQNGRDTTVAHLSPRLITEDPKLALAAARKICNETDFDFVENVFIFWMEADRQYTLHEMRAWADDQSNEYLVYFLGKKPGCSDEPSLVERFNSEQFRTESGGLLAA
ncbi:MAG: hypothetical protein JWO73_925 [Candidatus Taylorbacteria bacterium]|nr:hypothetical protein [Candidatus Taylorbacteria bacterium]